MQEKDFEALQPHLRPVELPAGEPLIRRHQPVRQLRLVADASYGTAEAEYARLIAGADRAAAPC
ncbi:hypothetical protein [Methylobacterium sp. CM6257]|jgi:hypothetical protein